MPSLSNYFWIRLTRSIRKICWLGAVALTGVLTCGGIEPDSLIVEGKVKVYRAPKYWSGERHRDIAAMRFRYETMPQGGRFFADTRGFLPPNVESGFAFRSSEVLTYRKVDAAGGQNGESIIGVGTFALQPVSNDPFTEVALLAVDENLRRNWSKTLANFSIFSVVQKYPDIRVKADLLQQTAATEEVEYMAEVVKEGETTSWRIGKLTVEPHASAAFPQMATFEIYNFDREGEKNSSLFTSYIYLTESRHAAAVSQDSLGGYYLASLTVTDLRPGARDTTGKLRYLLKPGDQIPFGNSPFIKEVLAEQHGRIGRNRAAVILFLVLTIAFGLLAVLTTKRKSKENTQTQ